MFQLIIVICLVPGHNNSLYLGRAGCPHPGTVTVVCVYVQQTGCCLHTAINDQMTRKHTEPWTISKISNSPCLNVCLQNCYWLTRCQVFVLCPSGGSWWPGLASTVPLWQKKRRLVKIWPQARCWCWVGSTGYSELVQTSTGYPTYIYSSGIPTTTTHSFQPFSTYFSRLTPTINFFLTPLATILALFCRVLTIWYLTVL